MYRRGVGLHNKVRSFDCICLFEAAAGYKTHKIIEIKVKRTLILSPDLFLLSPTLRTPLPPSLSPSLSLTLSTGRSGSTTLMELLNSLPGALLTGEHFGHLQSLLSVLNHATNGQHGVQSVDCLGGINDTRHDRVMHGCNEDKLVPHGSARDAFLQEKTWVVHKYDDSQINRFPNLKHSADLARAQQARAAFVDHADDDSTDEIDQEQEQEQEQDDVVQRANAFKERFCCFVRWYVSQMLNVDCTKGRIHGFKEVRYATYEMLAFLKDVFPCAKFVLNYRRQEVIFFLF